MKLVVASHGNLCCAVIESAEMLFGNIDNCIALPLHETEDVQSYQNRLIDAMNEDEDILLLVDIFGGTPSNQALMNFQNHSNVRIISGFNIGMVLEICINRDILTIDELCEKIIVEGQKHIINLSEYSRKQQYDIAELD